MVNDSKVTITKTPIDNRYDSDRTGFDYVVEGREKTGNGQLLFNTVRSRYIDGSQNDVYLKLLEEGLKDDDIISWINEFYPNGNGLDEETGEHMRGGVGSALYDDMVKDSIEYGAKAIIAISMKKSMQNFLLNKQGFTQADRSRGKSHRYYKIISKT